MRDADPSPPSSAVGHETVGLYLYSPYGPYGLYRASVPVQGCTLPLLMFLISLMSFRAYYKDIIRIILFFSVALRPNSVHGLLIFEVSRSHTTMHHSR